MTRPIRILAVIFVMGFSRSAGAFEIIKFKTNRFLVRLDGKTVTVGEQLDVIGSSGNKKGVVEITKFNETKALAKIVSGTANVGMTLAKRTAAVANDYASHRDSEIASNNDYVIRVNPMSLLLGSVYLNFDFKIARDWTVGVQGAYLHATLPSSGIFTSNYDISAYGFGARANWFDNGAFKDGWYFGPSLEYLTVNVKTADAAGNASGTASGMMATCIVGYGWFWNSFNIMLGAGYGAVLGASSITIRDPVGKGEIITANLSGIALELSIGWAF